MDEHRAEMLLEEDRTPVEAGQVERELGEMLGELSCCPAHGLEEMGLPEAGFLVGAEVRTFEDAGLLTRARGVVLRLRNGAEFQLTIEQSAAAR
jgi:hypothetical protein